MSHERWALVTGASRGIGRAAAIELANQGWNVAISWLRSTKAAAETEAEITGLGGRCLSISANVINDRGRTDLIEKLFEVAPSVSGFVHAAALGATGPVLEAKANRWTMAWDSHVMAFIELTRMLRPRFTPAAGVVALSSLGTFRVGTGYGPIAASKGALETLVRYLAVELAEEGVNVNAVCGGPIETDSLRSLPDYSSLVTESGQRPSGRMGEPEDLAPIVAWLLDEKSRWVRGQIIVADGGFSLV